MGNLFADLPLPALNGPGAAVNTSGMGSPKTLEVAGSFQGAGITVEASVDGGTTWGPVTTFTNVGGQRVVQLAAELMRVRVSGRKASVPFTANCDVGAPDAGSLFALIPMPVLNGPGASVNVSSFGTQCTFIAGGDFPGASIRVEISEDGVAWATLLAFAGKGDLRSTVVTAAFVRANVSGRNPLVAFSGTLAMGAANDGAAAAGIAVSDDGTSIGAGPFTELDFIGGGVVAADAGGGVASITIAGGGSNVVVWDVGKTWAAAYAEIQALTGPVICLVEPDPTQGFNKRIMTANGGVPTELWNVQFWALPTHTFWINNTTDVRIEVDNTFRLATNPDSGVAVLLSKNIYWVFKNADTLPIATGPIWLTLEGGGIEHQSTYLFAPSGGHGFRGVFKNEAEVYGGNGSGLVDLTNGSATVELYSRAYIRANVFRRPSGTQSCTVFHDGTGFADPTAFLGVTPTHMNSSISLIAPNGQAYRVTVSNLGVLTTVASAAP